MSKRRLGDFLADRWLASISVFDRNLVDTGERYKGNPVFRITYHWGQREPVTVKVYRYILLDSEQGALAFLPEELL